MKKVKISLRPGSPGKKFYLFPNAEALYVWLCHMERNETIQVPGIEELVLEPGGFIEAELRGFEYVYEDKVKFRRLDLVRLGKAQQPKNASGTVVSTHTGWVSGGLMPMRRYTDADIEVQLINGAASKLNLPVLFKDPETATPKKEEDDGSIDIDIDEDKDTGDPPPDDEDDK